MVLSVRSYTISYWGFSDQGLVRSNNEDMWQTAIEESFFALADGMGGHQAGEIASKEAVTFLCSYMEKEFPQTEKNMDALKVLLKAGIEETNRHVFQMSKSHELLSGMGTTLCTLFFREEYALWTHVGDSRIYRLRNEKLEQLTQDHSLLRELINGGALTEKEKEEFLYKNIITKAIGTEADVEAPVHVSFLEKGDIFLLCTDGLSDMLPKGEIEEILKQPYTVEEKVRALIHAAKQKGGLDNITTVLMEVVDEQEKDLS